LYVGAMFHDLGLVEGYRSDNERFEVDGANAAAAFLKPYGLSDDDIEQVWLSIALHTTPGVPKHLRPTVALVTAGVEMDVLGMDYAAFSPVQRERWCMRIHAAKGSRSASSARLPTACAIVRRPRSAT
jgi:hypothetical protein